MQAQLHATVVVVQAASWNRMTNLGGLLLEGPAEAVKAAEAAEGDASLAWRRISPACCMCRA